MKSKTSEPKHNPQGIVDELLALLASKEGLTIDQGAEVLEAAGRQIRKGMHEVMAKELAKKVSDVFEPKADIKIVGSLH